MAAVRAAGARAAGERSGRGVAPGSPLAGSTASPAFDGGAAAARLPFLAVAAVLDGPAGVGAARRRQSRVDCGGRGRMGGAARRARCSLARGRRPRSPAMPPSPACFLSWRSPCPSWPATPRRERHFRHVTVSGLRAKARRGGFEARPPTPSGWGLFRAPVASRGVRRILCWGRARAGSRRPGAGHRPRTAGAEIGGGRGSPSRWRPCLTASEVGGPEGLS